VPSSAVDALNKTTVLAAAIDFRPLSFAKYPGFQMLAQKLVDTGAKHWSVAVSSLCKDSTVTHDVFSGAWQRRQEPQPLSFHQCRQVRALQHLLLTIGRINNRQLNSHRPL